MCLNKVAVTILAVFMSVLVMGRSVCASVAVPIFPYMPPADVEMFDMLFNAFGMTVPDIEDDVKRLEGYWKLFEMATIANVEATKDLIRKAFEKARTSRVVELTPESIDAIRQVGKEALTNGVTYIQNNAVTLEQTMYDRLMLWNRIQGKMTEQEWNVIVSASNQKFGRGQWTVCAIFSSYRSDYSLAVGAYPKDYTMRRITGIIGLGNKQWSNIWVPTSGAELYPCVVFTKFNNGAWSNANRDPWVIGTDNYFSGSGKTYDGINLGKTAGVASVTAQNAQISDGITQGTIIPITAETALLNGVIDDTKPFKMRLPVELPVPAETVAELPAVQEKLGVIPISDDVTESVQALQDALTAQYGDATEYSLDLTRYFPFCIPFDIGRIFGAFVAEPVAPVIPFTFPVGYEDGAIKMQTFYMDLSQFDSVAYWCRKGELLLFIVGLGVVTRQWFLRG